MTLYVPSGVSWGWFATNHPGRPSASMGSPVAAGQNTYSPYTQIMAASAVTQDVWGVEIHINANSVSASARDTLVNIGASYSGAAGYTTIIPHLLGSCAPIRTLGPGACYYFPLHVPAGTAFGAQVSINSASLGSTYVYVRLYGMPSVPELVRRGAYVQAIGASPASSRGVIVTPGTTSEGAWTLLGSTASPAWWWQIGVGCNDDTMSALIYTADIGAGSPVQIITTDRPVITHGTAETLSTPLHTAHCEFSVRTAEGIYGRLQCSGTPDSNMSLIVYGVGG